MSFLVHHPLKALKSCSLTTFTFDYACAACLLCVQSPYDKVVQESALLLFLLLYISSEINISLNFYIVFSLIPR